MKKIDFKKTMSELYSPKNKDWQLVEVPSMNFLMIDGKGDPNLCSEYKMAIETLYSISYALKFISKKELERDYVIPPLEGIWYAEDSSTFEIADKSNYKWTMMIMQPDWITVQMFEKALVTTKAKKKELLYAQIRLEPYHEGLCYQLLHIGSYDNEAPKLHYLHHELMTAQKVGFNGEHHEIYLSDPRKMAPEKLKTILRQPICKLD